MKISKSQLKQIIKEEINAVLESEIYSEASLKDIGLRGWEREAKRQAKEREIRPNFPEEDEWPDLVQRLMGDTPEARAQQLAWADAKFGKGQHPYDPAVDWEEPPGREPLDWSKAPPWPPEWDEETEDYPAWGIPLGPGKHAVTSRRLLARRWGPEKLERGIAAQKAADVYQPGAWRKHRARQKINVEIEE
jgi:hypothetical protein